MKHCPLRTLVKYMLYCIKNNPLSIYHAITIQLNIFHNFISSFSHICDSSQRYSTACHLHRATCTEIGMIIWLLMNLQISPKYDTKQCLYKGALLKCSTVTFKYAWYIECCGTKLCAHNCTVVGSV